jgi:FkbM family methyltransferase
MGRLFEKARAQAIRAADRVGKRDELQRLTEKYLPSYEAKRDGQDRRNFDVVLSVLLAPDDLCVDVGANIGKITATMVRCAPEAKHVVCEALPDLAAQLADRYPGCEVHAVACADREGTAQFVRVVVRPTRSGLNPGQIKAGMTTQNIEVRVKSLDVLLGHRRPRVIKIDVEGAELDVLRGATATLRNARPVVLFEHQPSADEVDAKTSAIHQLLVEHDYRVFDVDGNGPLTEGELVETCRAGKVWNFIATPA